MPLAVGVCESDVASNFVLLVPIARTSIVLVLPLLMSLAQQNLNSYQMVDLLQANNLAAPSASEEDCAYLKSSVQSWLKVAAVPQPASLFENTEDTYVLWAQVLPVRCDFQRTDGVITFCDGQAEEDSLGSAVANTCLVWDDYGPSTPDAATSDYFAKQLSLRSEGIRRVHRELKVFDVAPYILSFDTTVVYNYNPTVALV
jgi:hypothetical protein